MNKHEDRILFLKQFTRELILNSKTKEEGEEEKFEEQYQILVPHKQAIQAAQATNLPTKPVQPQRYQPSLRTPRRQLLPRPMPFARPMPPQSRFQASMRGMRETSFMPQPQIHPNVNIDLDKLNSLIHDPRISIIECPGPDKVVLAKIGSQVTATKMSLSQNEIQNIIEQFSKEAKIPIIPGLFKAAAGNLVITAVISDLVGSRFIISKITPSFILENQGFQ